MNAIFFIYDSSLSHKIQKGIHIFCLYEFARVILKDEEVDCIAL